MYDTLEIRYMHIVSKTFTTLKVTKKVLQIAYTKEPM